MKKNINLRIKSFLGERKVYKLNVPIMSNTEQLYTELKKQFGDDMKFVVNPTFYYPMVKFQK